MITNDDIKHWQVWLKDYVAQHYTETEDVDTNIRMKYQHCLKVANEANHIAKSLNMSQADCNLVYMCGLFHDIGRFRQYMVYHTFVDAKSVYHGKLGVEVMEKLDIFNSFNKKNARIIRDAIYNHGLFKCEEKLRNSSLHFVKITRDADKLDIFRIVIGYYNQVGKRNIAIELGLDRSKKISDKVFSDFKNGKMIMKSDLVYLNDFKLLQLGWIYDINFDYTRNMIYELKYLDQIADTIEGDDIKKQVKDIVKTMQKTSQ